MLPHDLESLAARHVPGAGELVIQPLRNGLVNETYRVLRDGNSYALRVAALNPYALGLDRAWEARVLDIAAAADVAPAVEYCDPQRGILIARWVEGRTLRAEEIRRKATIARVAGLMRRIHALSIPPPARVMSPSAWIGHYSAAVHNSPQTPSSAAGLHAAATACLSALTALPGADPVMCHGDLHALNLIDRGHSLVLIDWEYAHAADPLWDLAGWSANNDLEDEFKRELLTTYLGRSPIHEEYLRLQMLGWLYDYVCLLWSELYLNVQRGARRDDMAPGSVFARAKLLAARLIASK